MAKFLIFLLIMSALIGFIWHADIAEMLGFFQQRVEEEGPGVINEQSGKLKDFWEDYGEARADDFVADLTAVGKEKIDSWLEENGLNKYGDNEETVYAGGTPLFNEATGESVDRYVYLIKKFPKMIDELDLEKYLK
jgi:hypothetical protein